MRSRPQGADLIRNRLQKKYLCNVRNCRNYADEWGRAFSAQKDVKKDDHVRQNVDNSDTDQELFDLM